MNTFTYVITDENGIHARPAGMLVNFAKSTENTIIVRNGDKKADATKLFAVMSLGAKKGDKLEFTVLGENCDDISAKLREFLLSL